MRSGNEDTGAYSDEDEDDGVGGNAWRSKTPAQFAKFLEQKDKMETDDSGPTKTSH